MRYNNGGKQRRRLNYLKRTKKNRKKVWLINQLIEHAFYHIIKGGFHTEYSPDSPKSYTTQGIIPFIKEHMNATKS